MNLQKIIQIFATFVLIFSMKRILIAIRRWRDQRFLKRLERVLSTNVLEADIIFLGNVAATYNHIKEDPIRGYRYPKGLAGGNTPRVPACQDPLIHRAPGQELTVLTTQPYGLSYMDMFEQSRQNPVISEND